MHFCPNCNFVNFTSTMEELSSLPEVVRYTFSWKWEDKINNSGAVWMCSIIRD